MAKENNKMEVPHHKVFHFDEINESDILYFHRNKVVAYPYYLGHARARGNLLYRLGAGAKNQSGSSY